MQEEEDEDDMSGSGREELTAPHNSLNRRGSRSEGKLNIALQERLAESERRKEKTAATSAGQKAPSQATTGSPGILRVAARDDTSSPAAPSWAPPAKKTSPGNSLDFRPKSAVESTSKANVPASYIPGSNKWKVTPKQPEPIQKPSSLPSVRVSCVSSTSIITESSTISIPVHTLSTPGMLLLPKYKTMPSPTRPMHSVLSSPQLALNEIFEEGDGGENLGPRPSSRGFVGRQQGQGRPGGYEQRRSKFHKTRTASCSSSDASDDDSESRKKRAHKLGETGKSLPQRRDSHDDSSDSQDPGGSGGTGGGVGGGGTPASGTECGGRPPAGAGAGVSDSSRTSGGNSNAGSGGKRQCNEASQQPSLSRRHRTGRRRAGETRLRESQSLNRITEVQEAEQTCHSSVVTSRSTSSSSCPRVRGFGARLLQSWSLAGSTAKRAAGGEVKSSTRQSDMASMLNSTAGLQVASKSSNTVETNCCAEEKENFCRTGMSKKTSTMTEKQKNGGSKKGRLLGRYFQVHKKLCLPLPGLFNRGRLYKAQSCGSIVRDRVAPPSPASLLLCSDDRWCPITSGSGTKMAGPGDNRHMVSNGSMGDINQNLGHSDALVTADGIIPLGATCPGIGMCHIHLGDASKCCNLC